MIFKFNTSRRSKVREFNWIQYKDFWPKSCMTLTSSRENWLKVVIAHPLLIWALCVWILSQIWKGIGKISRTKSLQRFAEKLTSDFEIIIKVTTTFSLEHSLSEIRSVRVKNSIFTKLLHFTQHGELIVTSFSRFSFIFVTFFWTKRQKKNNFNSKILFDIFLTFFIQPLLQCN